MGEMENIQDARETAQEVLKRSDENSKTAMSCRLTLKLCGDAENLMATSDELSEKVRNAKRAFGYRATRDLYASENELRKASSEITLALSDHAHSIEENAVQSFERIHECAEKMQNMIRDTIISYSALIETDSHRAMVASHMGAFQRDARSMSSMASRMTAECKIGMENVKSAEISHER